MPLLRQQHDQFQAGDIFLGDKGFCSYYDVDKFQQLGVDSVISLGVRKPVAAASALEVSELLQGRMAGITGKTDIAADKGGR